MFNRHAKEMKLWFANGGYADWQINREMGKAKHKPNEKSIRARSKEFLFFLLIFWSNN